MENCRQFGGPWLALELIRRLQLDAFLQRELASGQEHVPWSLSRADPRDCPTPGAVQRTAHSGTVVSQDKRCQNYWACRSSVSTTIGCTATLDEQHYEGDFAGSSQAVWMGSLFALDYDILLYDVTSTFFEGSADFPMAQRGYRAIVPQRLQAGLHWIGGVALWDAVGYEVFPETRPTSVPSKKSWNSWSNATGNPTVSGSWTGAWSARRT